MRDKLRTVELFSGTESFSNIAKKLGHETFTVEIDIAFAPDLVYEIPKFPMPDILLDKINKADVIWASPPCTVFSVAAAGTHWDEKGFPRTWKAIGGWLMIKYCLELIEYCELNKKLFFVENPMGKARWFMPPHYLHHVWYCRYGDRRPKPTDIWTNINDWHGKECKNGNYSCHKPVPRGSHEVGTTQTLDSKEAGKIPADLLYELFNAIDKKTGTHKIISLKEYLGQE